MEQLSRPKKFGCHYWTTPSKATFYPTHLQERNYSQCLCLIYNYGCRILFATTNRMHSLADCYLPTEADGGVKSARLYLFIRSGIIPAIELAVYRVVLGRNWNIHLLFSSSLLSPPASRAGSFADLVIGFRFVFQIENGRRNALHHLSKGDDLWGCNNGLPAFESLLSLLGFDLHRSLNRILIALQRAVSM